MIIEFLNGDTQGFDCEYPFDETDLLEMEAQVKHTNIASLAQVNSKIW